MSGSAQLSEVLEQATGVVAARGEGVLLYDEDDRRYPDFTAGIGVTAAATVRGVLRRAGARRGRLRARQRAVLRGIA